LIAKLENSVPGEDRVTAEVLNRLRCFLREMETAGARLSSVTANATDAVFGELRQFWLDSVPWCSDLSRDVEKIMILYEELADRAS
jgi:hypothetical protein